MSAHEITVAARRSFALALVLGFAATSLVAASGCSSATETTGGSTDDETSSPVSQFAFVQNRNAPFRADGVELGTTPGEGCMAAQTNGQCPSTAPPFRCQDGRPDVPVRYTNHPLEFAEARESWQGYECQLSKTDFWQGQSCADLYARPNGPGMPDTQHCLAECARNHYNHHDYGYVSKTLCYPVFNILRDFWRWQYTCEEAAKGCMGFAMPPSMGKVGIVATIAGGGNGAEPRGDVQFEYQYQNNGPVTRLTHASIKRNTFLNGPNGDQLVRWSDAEIARDPSKTADPFGWPANKPPPRGAEVYKEFPQHGSFVAIADGFDGLETWNLAASTPVMVTAVIIDGRRYPAPAGIGVIIPKER